MYVDEPPKDGNIPDFNISKIDICPFRAYQRSFRLFQSDFSTDIHQRSRLLCFTQNDHTGQTGFKICPFLKWAQTLFVVSFVITKIGSLVMGWIIHLFKPFISKEWIAAPFDTCVCKSCGTNISESLKYVFKVS